MTEVEYRSNGTGRRISLYVNMGMHAEDPYASMEKDQLISMIHFLVKREDEPTNETRAESNSFELYLVRRRQSITQRVQENQELKDMVKELRDTHKQQENIGDVSLMKVLEEIAMVCPPITY